MTIFLSVYNWKENIHVMKKPLIALALLLTAATALTAQSTFRWGVNLYPNLTHRRLIALSNISQPAIDSIEKREVSRPSLSAGFTMGWRGKKLGFHTGINFVDAGYRTVKEATPEGDPKIELGSQRRFAFQNNYFEIPAEVNFYQSLGERSAFYFMLGSAISINTTNRYDTIYYSGERVTSASGQADSDDFRRINYAFQTGMGWEYAFSERLMMVLTPTFKFWMRGVLKENDLNRNLYSIGLNARLLFQSSYRE